MGNLDTDVKIYIADGAAARKLNDADSMTRIHEWVLPEDPVPAASRLVRAEKQTVRHDRKSILSAHQRFTVTAIVLAFAILFIALSSLSDYSCRLAEEQKEALFSEELSLCETEIQRMDGTLLLSNFEETGGENSHSAPAKVNFAVSLLQKLTALQFFYLSAS